MVETVVLGLDGATWTVLDDLIEQGTLPNIASLTEAGYSGTLESTYPPITAPAWLSMATGQNPGKTGVFYFLNRESPDSYAFETLGSEKFEGRSFWDVLSARGHSVGVFNFPMLYPPYELDGFMVSGLGSPEDGTITYPESLANDLERVTDGYQVEVPYADPKYADRPEELEDDLLTVVEKREAAIEYLLTDHDPDVFFGVVSATDWAQHYFWRHYDPEHVLHEESPSSDALTKVWERVDETVGLVAARAARDDARLLLVSDHGFGPVNRTFHSNDWLRREGFRVDTAESIVDQLRTTYFPHLRRLGEAVVSVVPQLNDVAKSVGTSIRKSPGSNVDVDASIAFAPRQNLTCGMVYFCTEDETSRRHVIEGLESLPAPDGEHLDVTVYDPADLYEGPNTDLAPDLLFTIDDFECAVDPRPATSGRVFETGPPSPARSGGHRREGVFVFTGPNVRSGSEGAATLLDVAPTLLWLQDEPIPEEMDGEPMFDAFAVESAPPNRVPLADLVNSERVVRRADDEEVQQRLEDLGYI
ncbi:alkaline phosphatase family protein [Haloplanus litoreus]|uniref:Alkaline phosphatase family protein n=1 Tax=Haloplanus litoreus TaxID=767515 RepID=A0ABD6A1P7_9EURY